MSINLQPPSAKIIPRSLKIHDDERIDNYYWLNDREKPEVIDYLNQEKMFYEQSTLHTKAFQESLFNEMKARIKEDDESVPYFYNGYWYCTRFEKGKDYPIHTRRKGKIDAIEEIMFDCNEMAANFTYFNLSGIALATIINLLALV